MANINAVVSKGYEWVENADGLVQITRERLNLAATPSVVVPIDDALIPKLVIAVGDESANVISVALQVKTVADGNNGSPFLLHAWISDAAPGAETAVTAGSGAGEIAASWTAGTQLQEITTAKRWTVITTTGGAATLAITLDGADVFYLCVELDGRIWVSDAITFT